MPRQAQKKPERVHRWIFFGCRCYANPSPCLFRCRTLLTRPPYRQSAQPDDALQIPLISSWIDLDRAEHFFHGCFETDPHRPRDDRVTNVEFAQRRDLVDELDVFVIDAMTSVDLQMGF